MVTGLHRRVVRAMASSQLHVVDVPEGQFGAYRWIGSAFIGIQMPVITACGAQLRGRHDAVVCMKPGSKVTCSRCRRISGVDRAPGGNQCAPNGMDGETAWAAAGGAR